MIFFDRSIPSTVPKAMLMLGLRQVCYHDQIFPQDTPDSHWLACAGYHGWTVITRDKKIRYRPGEIDAIIKFGVGCFIVNANKPLSRWEYMKIFALTLDKIEHIAATTRRPFIYTISRNGGLNRVR